MGVEKNGGQLTVKTEKTDGGKFTTSLNADGSSTRKYSGGSITLNGHADVSSNGNSQVAASSTATSGVVQTQQSITATTQPGGGTTTTATSTTGILVPTVPNPLPVKVENGVVSGGGSLQVGKVELGANVSLNLPEAKKNADASNPGSYSAQKAKDDAEELKKKQQAGH